MGILVKKQEGVYSFTGIGKLAVVGLIAAVANAFMSTIWSLYIDSFVHNMAKVGFISGFFTLVAFIFYFIFIPLIEKYDKARIYSIALIIYAIIYILLALNQNFYLFLILGFSLTVSMTLKISSFGILVRDSSQNKQLSRNEGLMYMFYNFAFAIGPLIAGLIIVKYSFSVVYFLSAIFVFLALLLFRASKIKDVKGKRKLDRNLIRNFIDFFKDRKRRLAYFLGGGVNLWWIFIYTFIPLLIIRGGLSKAWVGYFLFAIAIPLILLEYHFAKLAGKLGFKKIFRVGFIIPAILSFGCFFVSNIYLILLLLTLASIGMAMLEPTTEAYFFDILKGKEKYRFYGPYNTKIDVSHAIGKFIPAILLIFLPFKFTFALFGFFMLILFFLSFKARDIVERRRR